MAHYSDERKRLIQNEMRQNGDDRVKAELTTRPAGDIIAAGRITLTGGIGGVEAERLRRLEAKESHNET